MKKNQGNQGHVTLPKRKTKKPQTNDLRKRRKAFFNDRKGHEKGDCGNPYAITQGQVPKVGTPRKEGGGGAKLNTTTGHRTL